MNILDIDLAAPDGVWSDALRPHRASGRALLAAFNRQAESLMAAEIGAVLARPLWAGLKKAAGGLHFALKSHYGEELEELAGTLGVPASDLVMANASYDIASIGCSTLVLPTPRGPLHARNLDWDLGRGGQLRKSVLAVRVRNAPAGDYASVTWPGLFGVLTGMAPGRFSVTVNYVRHSEESKVGKLVKRAALGYWPVMWVVRQVLDEARDFAAAVRFLKAQPLLAPVLFTVAGTKNDERVVIERGTDTWAVRKPASAQAPTLTTNHYLSREFQAENLDLSEMDTLQRMEALETRTGRAQPGDAGECFRLLSAGDVLRPDTQHQVVMRARDGLMVVRVPGERGATTISL